MVRFIDLTDQILNDTFLFTWYNTINDTFININGEQTWFSWKEFEYDFLTMENDWGIYNIDRFRKLFPKEQANGN